MTNVSLDCTVTRQAPIPTHNESDFDFKKESKDIAVAQNEQNRLWALSSLRPFVKCLWAVCWDEAAWALRRRFTALNDEVRGCMRFGIMPSVRLPGLVFNNSRDLLYIRKWDQ